MQNAFARTAIFGAMALASMALAGCETTGFNSTPGLSGQLRDMKLQCDAGNYAMCSEIGHAMANARHEAGMWDGNTPWTKTTHN